MSYTKKLIFFLISVGLGFGLSKMVEPEVKEEIEIEITDEKISPAAKKIKETILTRYFTEKDPAKKLEISDEVMEKVILLFMANLGLKLTESEKELVKNPQTYEQYLQNALTLCPEIPKSTGPEVFLNDGFDEARQKLEDDLRNCRKTYGGLGKKPKLKTAEQKRKFINFEDNIFKKYGRTPGQIFPFDILSELWTEKPYAGKLQSMPERFTSVYLESAHGIFRTLEGEQGHISLTIDPAESKDKKKVKLKFLLETRIGLNLEETFLVQHPVGHSNGGKGPCRGLVLSHDGGRPIMHLIKIPGQEGFFGRVYEKDRLVSSFFVMREFSKKKLNPSRWGQDRGYW